METVRLHLGRRAKRLTSRRSQPPLALAVPLSRFTPRAGGGSAFFVRCLMPPWLYIWIARFGSGEQFRKATPADWRFHTGFFVLVPIYMIVGVYFGHSFLERAG